MVQQQAQLVYKMSRSLVIHCHGGGFVAQSSASHQVSHHSLRLHLQWQVDNLLCAQVNSASYPQWDGKWAVAYGLQSG